MLPLFEDEIARQRIEQGLSDAADARRVARASDRPPRRSARTVAGLALVSAGERLLKTRSLAAAAVRRHG